MICADLEWMIMPAVLSGQFYVAELEHKEAGARAPVAAVIWASVSNETDANGNEVSRMGRNKTDHL